MKIYLLLLHLFKKTHGLFPDGVIGLTTIRFLNLTAREKSQIRVNIEKE